jgi:hypothetical protein
MKYEQIKWCRFLRYSQHKRFKKTSTKRTIMNSILLWIPHYKSNTTKIMKFHSNYKFQKLKKTKWLTFNQTHISNSKDLGKQSFSIRFPLVNCFMRISFHLFYKVCTTNMNIFFAWYLHVIYLHYKYIDTPHITC